VLGITLTARHKGTENEMPMAGFPHHAHKEYLEKLNELRIYLPEIDVEEYSKRFCPNAEELLHI